ncbi:hypothetical protein CC78DRAFT_11651 [Lojkania enalia]|uniref:Uncharacterized protein n=1 Tax=Lojkania enalia TaxID=147567 RepID=A0A9P4TS77_9PLEO|nr:hypothetical protein CC78DRAFT_11651 [Didymosphaeria enalia]
MSGPSTERRPSVSSEPSATSSQTLNSPAAGKYNNSGEGSSSQRPSLSGSRQNSRSATGGSDSRVQDSDYTLKDDYIGEHDFAHRRHRVRRSGGFLLDSVFSTGTKTRQHAHGSPRTEDVKGKRSARHSNDGPDRQGRLWAAKDASSRSSPLSRQVLGADEDAPEGESRVDSANTEERRDDGLLIARHRQSVHNAPTAASNGSSGPHEGAPGAVIDPNQIVHMALNLSESRRRNLSAGQLMVPQSSGSRQYLNEQRRFSRNISPIGGRRSPSGLRHMSESIPRRGSLLQQGHMNPPSEATLVRRDKARAYIELRIQYLRLLEHLPPLKPDASAPGNFIYASSNVPGSPYPQLIRMPSHAGARHELGRAYNPLQYIRNRRIRARERKVLDHEPEEFSDIERVREWVDRVEAASHLPGYWRQDGVVLPELHEGHEQTHGPAKPNRPRMGWMFTSEELLADAHWLEQNDNKTILEDRHGRKIFPPIERQSMDLLQPRASKEYSEKRRKSWVEGLAGLSDTHTADESEPNSERGRKRRLLPPFRAESPKHKKHGWRSSRPQTGNLSDSSDSDSGSQRYRARGVPKIDINNNTGPLALRMQELMEKEAQENDKISPTLLSPDTPDKWGTGHARLSDTAITRSSMDSTRLANGSPVADFHISPKPLPENNKVNPALNKDNVREPRSSFEDLDSTAPNTPNLAKHFPHIGADLSPPPSRGTSVSRKPKKSKLDIFRSDENAKSHQNELDSAGSDRKRSSRYVSEEVADNNSLGTAILAAPSAVKSLLAHRKNDSVGSLNSPENPSRKDTRDFKEPSSAVTRFFKGVKNEGSKVGDIIFRRDRPTEDSDTDIVSSVASNASDSEPGSSNPRKYRPDLLRSPTAGSVTSKKTGRYHLDLPSFLPSNYNAEDKAYATDSQLPDDHITRQALARAKNRSPRFDKLAPPRIDLRSISASSSPGPSRPHTPSANRHTLEKVLARPSGVGAAGVPVTGLARPPSDSSDRKRSTSRPTLEGKRHWSIADDDNNSLHPKTSSSIITQSDIARTRALFLCSGVKAKEIARRAHERRESLPAFLTRAAKTANAHLIPVPKKEEHVLAARILVNNLEASTNILHNSTEVFRESTVKNLTASIAHLKARVEVELFARVRSSGDEAVRITHEVSSEAPLLVKRVTDEIDRMIRNRRRRMRWARRVGWMLVEWMLLGLMWWLWFIVVVLRTVRQVVGWGWGAARWLLWI